MQVIHCEKTAVPYDDKKSLYTLFKKNHKNQNTLANRREKDNTPIEMQSKNRHEKAICKR